MAGSAWHLAAARLGRHHPHTAVPHRHARRARAVGVAHVHAEVPINATFTRRHAPGISVGGASASGGVARQRP
eukprot:scaffold80092_cov72-Phaeocystis_antarctica.AAC.4